MAAILALDNRATISQLLPFEGADGPYKMPLKVMVVECLQPVSSYAGDGTTKASKTAAVSDGREVAKLICYNSTKFNKIIKGNSLTIHNLIVRRTSEKTIVVTAASRIFVGIKFNIPEDHQERGHHILNPPPAMHIPISSALKSPTKEKCTVAGKIVQDEAVDTVTVKGDQVPIRNIHVEDTTGTIKVTLWRDASISPIKTGDYNKIKDVITNSYKNEISLSTTSRSTIEKGDAPVFTVTVEIVAVGTNETEFELLLADDPVVKINKELVQSALSENMDIESLVADGPVKATITYQGSYTMAIAFV